MYDSRVVDLTRCLTSTGIRLQTLIGFRSGLHLRVNKSLSFYSLQTSTDFFHIQTPQNRKTPSSITFSVVDRYASKYFQIKNPRLILYAIQIDQYRLIIKRKTKSKHVRLASIGRDEKLLINSVQVSHKYSASKTKFVNDLYGYGRCLCGYKIVLWPTISVDAGPGGSVGCE